MKLQFRDYLRIKLNENVQNCIRPDQKKNINVCKGNHFFINKKETKRSVYFSE